MLSVYANVGSTAKEKMYTATAPLRSLLITCSEYDFECGRGKSTPQVT